jgi:hypothetical protein
MSDTVTRLNAALAGRYEIERELGRGGMATVYLADDLRHERKVALKVLKPELAAVVGSERFLGEIKTTANLQHPHILPLFDSGEAESFLFYVMPFVEGESLQERLAREGQLPVDEAVRIAGDVAEALHTAHEHGVLHRDIKPANILLSRGRPLVADFGIALALSAAGTARLTETGLSVGTPHYMSPEQASGDRDPNPASDVYSLGCVLYEMLVGEPPYPGRSAQAILARILTDPVPGATKARPSVPANVDSALRKALEKVPADRFATAQGFARALRDPRFRHRTAGAADSPPGEGLWKVVSLAASVVAVLATAVAAWSFSRPASALSVERFVAPFGDTQAPPFSGPDDFNLSPDGAVLVYRAPGEQGPNQLWVRRWDSLEPSPIRETGTGIRPTVSLDGEEVAFEMKELVTVASLQDGSMRTLTDGTWPHFGRDGYVYASVDGGIVRVPSAGGTVDTVMTSSGVNPRLHDVLPGGEAALIRVENPDNPDEVQVQGLRLESGETTLIAIGDSPRYLPSGHLVFLAPDSTLMAARFDPKRLEMSGRPKPVLDQTLAFSLSDSGRLFYTRALADAGTEFVWVTRVGEALPADPGWTFNQGVGNAAWSLSPDGTRVALMASNDGNDDIWVKELGGGPSSRLTFDEGQDWSPHWSPDGTMVTFVSIRLGDRDVWTKRADGTGDAELLYDPDTRIVEGFWSPDQEWLVLRGGAASAAANTRDILAARPGVDGSVISLMAEAYDEEQPTLSPDGRWLAYVSTETGSEEVFVRPFPDVNAGRWQVSTDGGIMPLWAHSGRELFFVQPNNALIAVEVELGSGFQVVGRVELFTIPDSYRTSTTNSVYDLSPDDQRFLMARSYQPPEGSHSPFVLVQNFGEELKRLVPD